MIDKTEKWERDDNIYINTRATEHVLACINEHKYVSVIGPSGIGKTALVRHVALQMEIDGYTILPIADPNETEKRCISWTICVGILQQTKVG